MFTSEVQSTLRDETSASKKFSSCIVHSILFFVKLSFVALVAAGFARAFPLVLLAIFNIRWKLETI